MRNEFTRSGATITVRGTVVEKLHLAGTDPRLLARRVRLATELPQFLSPLAKPVETDAGTRTLWPLVTPLKATSPDEVAWERFAALLADLHTTPPPDDAPLAGTEQRWARVLAALPDVAPEVTDLARALPEPSVVRRAVLIHGDAHLGQLAFDGGRLVLLDADDLGLGDPADDLARIAGAWASGQLGLRHWARFLDSYRAAGGPAVPAEGDPWPSLDAAARRSIVTAYYGLRRDRLRGDQPAEEADLAHHLAQVMWSW